MSLETVKKAFKMLKEDGLKDTLKQVKVHMEWKKLMKETKGISSIKDILLINGCSIDYCERYRMIHKKEEFEAFGLSCDLVEPYQLNHDMISHYRGFIIYRFAWDQGLQEYIDLMHEKNKVVFYDVDDLVFDLKYTKKIKQLEKLSKEELDVYNDGVVRFGKCLKACDYGITTTKVIADEMKHYVNDVCIDKNIASLDMFYYSEEAIKKVEKDSNKVIIGYASGSMTHNADFELVAPSLKKLLDKYDNVYLKLIGVIEVPEMFKDYSDRIITHPFVDYKKLPALLRTLDINLAPLEDTLFNRAKSCIKWMEAGLVKVPTVASNVGDFHDNITDGVNGVLCNDSEWYKKLEVLVKDKSLREEIGNNAYNTTHNKFTAITSGKILADFIKSKLNKNYCFVLPSTNISGGILVALKHAIILKNKGYDVTILNANEDINNVKVLQDGNEYIDVIDINKSKISIYYDVMVATMWSTVEYVRNYGNNREKIYLVQGKETGFYKYSEDYCIFHSNATYNNLENIKYITVSKWCQDWLKNEYGTNSVYIPNGLDIKLFPYEERDFKGKIKILIEGDSKSAYKNVDEAFKITNKLDKNKYEIHYLSYNGEAKDWYQVDKAYYKVNHDEVFKIYQKCDILLKTSVLEGFSYPPLEMMATGGLSVVVPNEGNIEYLEDNYNCLFYKQGDIDEAISKIEELVNNKKLRDKLIKNGLDTAKGRDWKELEKNILKVYTK